MRMPPKDRACLQSFMPYRGNHGYAKTLLGILCLILAHGPAMGGQFSYKSAVVMAPKSCGSEVWYGDHEEAYGAELTCRLDAPASLKLETLQPRGESGSYALEAKYQVREHGSEGIAVGLVTTSGFDPGAGRVTDAALVVPISVRLVPDRLNVHLNVGGVHVRDVGDTKATWGTAVELRIAGPFTAIGEAFATGGEDPTLHAGLQAELMDGRLAMSLSYLDEGASGGLDGWLAGAAFHVVSF